MIVAINDRPVEYLPDYPTDWKISGGDPYKFPVVINNVSCFVKRFEKKNPQVISGWALLNALKGKNIKGSPRIFDIKENIENGKSIYYLFYKYFEGRTLDKITSLRNENDLLRLRDDLLTAYDTIHGQNFWISDFCGKNIFWDKDGNFYLIDLDGAQPFSSRPDIKMYGSKDYWIPVLDYYRKYAGKPNIKPENLHGSCLNHLQLFFLVLHYKLKLSFNQDNQGRNKDYFDLLPDYLNSQVPEVRDVFIELLEGGGYPISESIIDNIRAITNKIISSDNSVLAKSAVDPLTTQSTTGKPLITYFKSDKKRAARGESFLLSWEVKDADRIELIRNGIKLKDIDPAESSITRSEFYDGTSDAKYELLAFKGGEQAKSVPITISFTSKKRIPAGGVLAAVGGVLIVGLLGYFIFFRNHRPFQISRPIVYEDSTLAIDIKGNWKLTDEHIYFDTLESTQVSQIGRQLIARVPAFESAPSNVTIAIRNSQGKVIFSKKAEFVPVSIKEISGLIAYENSAMTLLGYNLGSRNITVSFNNIPASIISSSYDSIVVGVPEVSANPDEPVVINVNKGNRLIGNYRGIIKEDQINLQEFVQGGRWESGTLVPFSVHSPVDNQVISTHSGVTVRRRNLSASDVASSIAENSTSLAARAISVNDVVVSLANRNNFLFDRQIFVSNGVLPFPGADNDSRGFVRIDHMKAEDGMDYVLIRTHPRWVDNGSVKGYLRNNSSLFSLKGKKRFTSRAGYLLFPQGLNNDASDGVNFQVFIHYNKNGNEISKRIVFAHKNYTNSLAVLLGDFPAEITDQFYVELRVDAGPQSGNDWAVWIQPQIIARKIVF